MTNIFLLSLFNSQDVLEEFYRIHVLSQQKNTQTKEKLFVIGSQENLEE